MKKLMSGEESSRNLPNEIIITVLLKLPVKSIVQCRCVCKSWRNLISTPYFANLHFSEAPASLLFASNQHIPYVDKPRVLFSHAVNDDSHVGCLPLSPNNSSAMMRFDEKFNLPFTHGALVGSCNGLLCLAEIRSRNKFYICNPITGEYVEILGTGWHDVWPIGFYCSPQSHQCKILAFINPTSYGYRATFWQIFTLGSNSWRNFDLSERYIYCCHDLSCSIPLDGAINWVAGKDNGIRPYVCSFDMESEQVRRIAFPSEINSRFGWRLGMVGNVLCLYDPLAGGQRRFKMWVMEKYGVEESWQRHSINVDEIFNQPEHVRLLEIKEDGSILMIDFWGSVLISYDIKTKKSRKVEFEGTPPFLGAVLYTPTFVSLKDALNIGDGCLKVQNVRSKYCPNQDI